MAQKDLLRQLELEKQKREMARKASEPEQPLKSRIGGDLQQAWELELSEYQKQRKKQQFYAFGAWCGILALLIEIVTRIIPFSPFLKKLFHIA